MDKTKMKKLVAYGAGNIGRGFVGQLFSESGYRIVFVDVNKEVVAKLNQDQKYPVRIISPDKITEIQIENVCAVDGMDIPAVAAEIADADVITTAVGVNVLPRIVRPILAGLRKRWENGNMIPVNIIICENLIDSSKYLKKLFIAEMNEQEAGVFEKTTGLVEASIGRMVPVMTKEMQEGNILRVWVEEYCMFPVDKDAFVGKIPKIKNLIPYSPFSYYIQRKLFIHNLGHAMVSYLGYLFGFEYVWQGALDKTVRQITKRAMTEAARALSAEHDVSFDEIMKHVDDLLYRFSNKHLGDTVNRVAGDPIRKLSANDRLTGAAMLCLKHGIDPVYISFGIWAALSFAPGEDPSAKILQEKIIQDGVIKTLEDVCGISKDSPLIEMILGYGNTNGDI